jgi:hypothetical protein
MSALGKIKDAGFTLSLTDSGNLKVAPFKKLIPEQREFLKQHKDSMAFQKDHKKIGGKSFKVMAKDAEHKAFMLRI